MYGKDILDEGVYDEGIYLCDSIDQTNMINILFYIFLTASWSCNIYILVLIYLYKADLLQSKY